MSKKVARHMGLLGADFQLLKKYVLILGLAGWVSNSVGQDIQFSQYRTFPLYLNPASTGNIDQQRLAFNSRSQWVGIDGAFNTIGASYDYNWSKLSSGLGVMLLQDEMSAGGFSTFTGSGLYSYHLQISDNVRLRTGVRVSYFQERLNPKAVTFADQLIRNDGSETYEQFDQLSHDYMDYSWGSILYISDEDHLKHLWVGMAFDHLTKPEVSFNQFDGNLPVKFTLHGGGEHRLSKNQKGFPEHVITYTILYKAQLKWDQAEFGASYIKRIPHKKRTLTEWKKTQAKFEPSYKQNFGLHAGSKTPLPLVYAEAGLKYRGLPLLKHYESGYSNHEAIVVMIAMGYYNLKVAYTFDWTISTLRYSNSGGAHEISMIYNFNLGVSENAEKKKKGKKQKALLDGL